MAKKQKHIYCLIFYIFVLNLAGCNSPKSSSLFQLLSSEDTGIHFSNTLTESDSLNILTDEYIYNGGGVGVGDFNNDGLMDLYFTGNMVSNKLYLNKGNLKFDDATDLAGVTGEGKWCSGVAIVDINNDGWMDIYVGATFKKDSVSRQNLLYINQGLNKDKILTFKESASEYGIADSDHTTHSAFFDYDNDGDLDLYVLTNIVNEKIPGLYRPKIIDGSSPNNDKLYRNNGNGTFTNVTKEANILIEGYGLGIAISDINLDGWMDIYVTNDYMSNDLLYINNQNGTFTNRLPEYIKHTCFSAMGNDVVDINNDGFVDIIALDMLPESNFRKKMMVKNNNYFTYMYNQQFGYQYQYVRNVLQLNQGITPKGHPVFSEIGQLAGVYQTDWSWAPLVADFDNDGFRDMIITNGFPRDVTDLDFAVYRSGPAGNVASTSYLADSIPIVKTSNYAFKNNGNLTFSNKTKDWGMDIPSFSNGGVYADLDNDGDLDVVVNTINDKALVYENQLYKAKDVKPTNHYLRVNLAGTGSNLKGFGAKIKIAYGNGKHQFYEHSPYRGYLSTVENKAHFGLGESTKIDSVQIYWLDGKYQVLANVPADQEIIVKQSDASVHQSYLLATTSTETLFREVDKEHSIRFKHAEDDKIDFNMQRTIPHKYTQGGPGIAVGDVDGNGLDDFYIGGSAGKKGVFFIQSKDGKFTLDSGNVVNEKVKFQEDMGTLFFDADNDKDLDLYVVSGSYEFEPGSPMLQDRLYRNMGKGKFQLDSTALPRFSSSGSCAKAGDYDQDGDLDLFVGGRVVPGKYPLPPSSYILRNDSGKFTDVTDKVCPELTKLGMISDALWTDFDNDSKVDLILAGEWLPITFYKNINGTLKNVTSTSEIGNYVGWWNSLSSGDFDNDGDIDYVAGNLGLNSNYTASDDKPLSVYAKDFDENGSMDPIMVCYTRAKDGSLKPFPMHTRDDLIAQMTPMRKRFHYYKQYALSTIDEVLKPEEKKTALILNANYFSSSYIENLGKGKFKISALQVQAQLAPTFGIATDDFDMDGNLDILLVGNDYGTEVFTGRYDAQIGQFLKGNGKGHFQPSTSLKSGFFVEGDAKGIAQLFSANGEKLIVVTQNQDSIKVFHNTKVSKSARIPQIVNLLPLDAWAEVTFTNGKKQRKEFYYGSTYLSQSSRKFQIDGDVKAITIFDFSGKSRNVLLNSSALSYKH